MRIPVSRRALVALVAAFLCSSGSGVGALELWDDADLDLPEGVHRALIVRTVTYAHGRAVEGAALRHREIERRSDDHVVQNLYDDDGDYLWTTHLLFDEQRLGTVRAEADDGVHWTLDISYDERGRPTVESLSARASSDERVIRYEYGPEVVEVISFRPDGSVAWRRVEQTRKDGGEQRTRYYYADGTRVKTIVTILNEDGQSVHDRHLDELGTVYRTVDRVYRNHALVTETVRDQANTVIRRTRRSYTPEGRLTGAVATLPSEGRVEETEIAYSLDEAGNWITQRRSMYVRRLDDGPRRIVKRELLERRLTYE